MEIIIILAVLLVALWWFFLRTSADTVAPKVEEAAKPQTTETPAPTPAAETPAWHTAPAEGTALATNVLDVNKDGKVNLEDVKEAVKKTRTRAKKAADVNGDGKVTKADAKAAVKKVKEKATKTVAKSRTRARAKKTV